MAASRFPSSAGNISRNARLRIVLPYVVPLAPFALLGIISLSAGCGGSGTLTSSKAAELGLPFGRATQDQVTHGRYLVITAGCSDCHSQAVDNPATSQWMAGYVASNPAQSGKFAIGPFTTYAANLTPDTTTGLGSVSDQQVYNALKYGLDPHESPDVAISSTTPGVGNFPSSPHYLAPPMPWPATRHFADSDLWAIVAYLKHGIKGVNNSVPDSGGPPDNWASSYTVAAIGPADNASYPASNEQFVP